MEEKKSGQDRWLDVATAGIWFPPDQRAVREELAAHLEDKAADLQRIFPDITPQEAQERAVEEMGDAAELGKELARLHKPWLGYLWRISKWAAAALAVALLAVNVLRKDEFQFGGYPLWGETRPVYGATAGEKIRMGGYTFQIVGAAYVDYPEDSPYEDSVQVAVRVSTPRFWEHINEGVLQSALTMAGPDGWAWRMDSGKLNTVWEEGRNQLVCGLERAEWSLFHDTYVAHGDLAWTEGESVCLEFAFGKGSFTLEAGQLERVVME